MQELLTIKEASEWASEHLSRHVTASNISYLVQYGRIQKIPAGSELYVNKNELAEYYRIYFPRREIAWKEKLGHDLNWHLSFEQLKEADTTKHVHRLHPYKGKYIPQLVEYFLDSHTDEFKKEVFFQPGDIILDPFCGSGTTLVQANELNMHAVGIDVSAFNALISNVKVRKCNETALQQHIKKASEQLQAFIILSNVPAFENALLEALQRFNTQWFPTPDYKYRLRRKEIDEATYSAEKEREFHATYSALIKEFSIDLTTNPEGSFLEKWYLPHIRQEAYILFDYIKTIPDSDAKRILSIILSRTMRSCRATTHEDLATLIQPVKSSYYCPKHGKMCKPLFSLRGWWERYAKDTLKRLAQFDRLRTDTIQLCLAGDSRTIDIFRTIRDKAPACSGLLDKQKFAGIFSSPPYIGLIDYHEQHAYAYDLFGFERHDDQEIGALSKGQSRDAKGAYVNSIADVLKNCRRFLRPDAPVFLVANDKYTLYPRIAELSGFAIIQQFRRPVLNRTEKDKGAYAETIFHMQAMT